MSAERFTELQSFLEPVLPSYEIDPYTKSLVMSLSSTAFTKDEMEALNGIIRKRTLKWAGSKFN